MLGVNSLLNVLCLREVREFCINKLKHWSFDQRLEFLGDAVLDYLITSYLYSVYPKLKTGQLTDLRSVFVNNQAFANVAVDRSLQKFLISDSSGLSKAINKYVDFTQVPASECDEDNWPKCPKVNHLWTFAIAFMRKQFSYFVISRSSFPSLTYPVF